MPPARGANGQFISVGVRVTGASGAAAEMGRVGNAMDSVGRGFRQAGDLARKGGLAIAAGAAAAAVAIREAVDVEQEFSRSMRLVQTNSGATAKQMGELEKAATTMGPKLGFGARESADAMVELAKAGLNANQIISGGLKGTLILAAAGAVDLGTASTIASNAMNSFGLESKDMSKIAGILAGGANASTASVESLGMALSQVGPGARSAGLDLNETVAALSAFDNAGIKGSDAGTALKTMLASLVPSNDKASAALEDLGVNALDAHGNFRSLEEIAGQLKTGMVGLTDAERSRNLQAAFGSDASRAAIVLAREGTAGIRKYIKATQDQGAAQRAVKAETAGTSGVLKRLSSEAEVAKLKFGQALAPSVVKASNALSSRMVPATEGAIRVAREWKQELENNGIDGVVRKVERLTDTQGQLSPIFDEVTLAGRSLWRIVKDLAPVFADAASQVPPFLSPLQMAGDVLDVAADVLEAIPDPIKSIGVQAAIAALILPRLTGAIASASGAMMVGTTRAIGYAQALRSTGTAAQTRAIGQMAGAARQAAGIGGIMGLSYALNKASDEGNSFGSVMAGAAGGAGIGMMFGPVGALVGAAAGGGLSALVGSFHKTASEAEAARLELLKTEGFKNAREDADSLREALRGVANAYSDTVRASVESSFFKDGKLEGDISNLRNLGVSMDTIVSATMGQADAQGIVNKALDGGVKSLKAQADSARAAYEQAKKGRDLVSQTGQVIGKENLTREQLEPYKKAAEETAAALKEAAIGQETFNKRVGENGAALQDRREQIRGLSKQLGITAQQYLNFPSEVRTRFESKGLPQTSSDALRLIRNYRDLQRFGRIRALVSAPGVDLTRGQISRLARQYKLTPKQVRTLMRAEGVESTVRDVRRVSKAVSDTKSAKPDLSGYQRALAHHMGDFRNVAERGGRDISDSLQKAPRKARLTMPGVAPSVRSGLGPAKSAASSGGSAVGSNIKYGFMGGFAGAAAEWAAATRGATRAAVNAARDEADIHSPSRKTHKIGKQMVAGASLAFKEGRSELALAGVNLIRDLVRGIDHEKASVSRVLAAVTDEVERSTNRVQKLQQLRAAYVSDFRGFSSSVFSAQAPTGEDGTQGPQSVGNMLSFAAAEAEKAKRVQAAVKRLTGKGGLGLSSDLIKQLRSQGAGGIDQILALASGSRQDIRRLNSYNKATNGAYTATGLGLFQQQGGSGRLAQAQHDQRVAESVAREVRRALQGLKIEGGQFRLEGTTLVATIRAVERQKGK